MDVFLWARYPCTSYPPSTLNPKYQTRAAVRGPLNSHNRVCQDVIVDLLELDAVEFFGVFEGQLIWDVLYTSNTVLKMNPATEPDPQPLFPQCAILSTVTIVCAKTFSSIFSNSMKNGFDTEFLHPAPYLVLLLMVTTQPTLEVCCSTGVPP